MPPTDKNRMLDELDRHKKEVTEKLFELGREDIPQQLEWLFSFMEPTGDVAEQNKDSEDDPYVENSGEVCDLSGALFFLHKVRHEIENENWPEAFKYGLELGKVLPDAAAGIFQDNKARSRHTGGKRKNLEPYKNLKPFVLDEAARLWAENPARPLTGRGGIAGAIAAKVDEYFFGNNPEADVLAETTVCTWIREADQAPTNPFKRPVESKKRGRPREK